MAILHEVLLAKAFGIVGEPLKILTMQDMRLARVAVLRFCRSYVDPKTHTWRAYDSIDSLIDQLIENERLYAEDLAHLC
jgi:hypothetical protein